VTAKRAPPERSAPERGELLPELLAWRLARQAALGEPGSGLEHERLDLRRTAADHAGHLLVREVPQLGEHEGRALVLGELAQVGEDLAQVGAVLNLVGEARRRDLDLVHRPLVPGPQRRQATVARNRVEPWLEPDLAVVALEVAPSGQEGVLDGVLCLLAIAHHVAAEGQDRPVVAVVHDLEGRAVAEPRLLDEALVPEGGEKA
jgi:hypothetical protein